MPVAIFDDIAEISVLGSMLLDNDKIIQVRGLIEPGDFHILAHRTIAEAIYALDDADSAVDFVTLRNRLDQEKKLEQIGGVEYLTSLIDGVPATANVLYYARIVKDLSRTRLLVGRMSDALRELQARGDTHAAIEAVDKALAEALVVASSDTMSLRDALKRGYDYLDRARERGKPMTLKTGLARLDKLIGGMDPGHFIALAARTSVGKTALASNIALRVAAEGESVLFFSLEMLPEQIALNLQAMDGTVSIHTTRQRLLTREEMQKLSLRLGEISGLPITLANPHPVGLREIMAICERQHRIRPFSLVIVDYLQLVKPPHAERHDLAMGDISRALKLDVAEKYRCPVILLAQINRELFKTDDKRPRLQHIRDSDRISQDADQVWLLHRPRMGLSTAEREAHRAKGEPAEDNYALLYVDKHRTGPTGTATLGWDAEHVRFSDTIPAEVEQNMER